MTAPTGLIETPAPAAGAEPPGGARLVSLDAFRGATIALMILVNNPGTWSAIYPPFRHAPWHGWTPTDLVFPFFLFIVGVSIVLAYRRRLEQGVPRTARLSKAAKRSAVLFALGLLMAAYPFVTFQGGVSLFDPGTLRIPGVLQRIALCYLAVTVLFLYVRVRVQVGLGLAILFGYWALMTLVPVPGVGPPALEPAPATLAAWVDRTLLGQHLWSQAGRMWDPEGVLSTFPAVVTTLIGVWTGLLLAGERDARGKVRRMLAWGAALTVVGLAWGALFPINKSLWTSSYVLLTGGLALLLLAATYQVTDVWGRRAPAKPLAVYGVNAITVFVASGVLAETLGVVRVPAGEGTTSLQGWIFTNLFAPLGPAETASLLYALVWVGGWYVVLRWMYGRGIVWKV